jgi:hypothetical protein
LEEEAEAEEGERERFFGFCKNLQKKDTLVTTVFFSTSSIFLINYDRPPLPTRVYEREKEGLFHPTILSFSFFALYLLKIIIPFIFS